MYHRFYPKTLSAITGRTVCPNPAIYTSKRAARPGMVCLCSVYRFALRSRRNSRKTTRKKPNVKRMGKHPKNAEKNALFWSHIARAYCNVETRFKDETADAAMDFLKVETVFECVARFGRYRSSKWVWFAHLADVRASHAQERGRFRVERLVFQSCCHGRTTCCHAKTIQSTRAVFHHFVAELVLFHAISLA